MTPTDNNVSDEAVEAALVVFCPTYAHASEELRATFRADMKRALAAALPALVAERDDLAASLADARLEVESAEECVATATRAAELAKQEADELRRKHHDRIIESDRNAVRAEAAERELATIKRVAACGSVQNWLKLSDEVKAQAYALWLDDSQRRKDAEVALEVAQARIAELEREREADRKDAERYRWLRARELDTIVAGGVFAGETPENVVINGEDLDAAIDAAIAATTKAP